MAPNRVGRGFRRTKQSQLAGEHAVQIVLLQQHYKLRLYTRTSQRGDWFLRIRFLISISERRNFVFRTSKCVWITRSYMRWQEKCDVNQISSWIQDLLVSVKDFLKQISCVCLLLSHFVFSWIMMLSSLVPQLGSATGSGNMELSLLFQQTPEAHVMREKICFCEWKEFLCLCCVVFSLSHREHISIAYFFIRSFKH